jgi:phenylpropionate dioxygenase-like ring-hydroxylating dioxygenase large terminal subunit
MGRLLDDQAVAQRVLGHIDHGTTDLSPTTWHEPVDNYLSEARLEAELTRVLRPRSIPFCPSAALPETGSYLARVAGGTTLLAVRGQDGRVRAFRNACRHRGAELAQGADCAKAFVCTYHGWSYRLDGSLLHVPHADGFPDLDCATRGLVAVDCRERHGLVFVAQHPPTSTNGTGDDDPDDLDELAGLITPDHRMLAAVEREQPVNWKVLVESFLEGYHNRSTHRETFYPLQFDNLTVVETFGPNSRITFPYRNVAKLRAIPPAERRVDGTVTFVYHLFPNVIVATFPYRLVVVVLEPRRVDATTVLTWALTTLPTAAPAETADRASRGENLLLAGAVEDSAMSQAVQRGLSSGANEFFEFGRFEGAIGHFHRALDTALGLDQ